jgi:glucose-6-phosphate isomerase
MANYRRRRWRDAMTVRLDLNGALAAAVGADGVAPEDLEDLEPRLQQVRGDLLTRRTAGELPFADLPGRRDDLRRVLDAAAQVRADFDAVVVLGIGGSALGARALTNALGADDACRVVVADSIDPDAFAELLAQLDVRRTLFNVISKSGETPETMAQFLIVRDHLLRELGAVDYKRHILVTTDAQDGAMRQIVNDEGFRDLTIPAGVGGRFSVLSSVGLFPAACAGVDVEELLAGAAHQDARSRAAESALADPALAFAGLLWLLGARRRKSAVVVMPYCERLVATVDWFCQLWSESLGKATDREGRPVAWGQTPARAVGAADQHSQLQLWIEGPRDKVLVFLRVEDHGTTIDIPAAYQDLDSVAYLGGRELGELLNAEQRATELALGKRGRPSMTLGLPAVNAFTVGQLLYLLQWATLAAAELIGVDAFGQPGVEEGKRLAYGLMGRSGFQVRREEVEAWLARKNPRFVV